MNCLVCGQESAKEELKQKVSTGIRRIRKCDNGHKFSTYQDPEGEERPSLVLVTQEQVEKLRREMIFQAYLDCKFEGQVQPETILLVETIRRIK